MQSFTVDDIHRRNAGAVVVVGIQSTEGKVFPASPRIASVLRDASARELGKFLGQLANVDGKGQVVSFTSTIAVQHDATWPGTSALEIIGAAAVNAETLQVREAVRSRQADESDRVSLADLGLNIPGAL